jgi:hypothetical protein
VIVRTVSLFFDLNTTIENAKPTKYIVIGRKILRAVSTFCDTREARDGRYNTVKTKFNRKFAAPNGNTKAKIRNVYIPALEFFAIWMGVKFMKYLGTAEILS